MSLIGRTVPFLTPKGLGPITFVNSSAISYDSSSIAWNNIGVVPVPSGVVAGDLMVMLVGAVGSASPSAWSPPSGWTAIISATGYAGACYRIATGAEPANYSWTGSSTGGGASFIAVAYRAAAYDAVGSVSTSSAGSPAVAASVTVSQSASVVLGFWGTVDAGVSNSSPAPTGMDLVTVTNSVACKAWLYSQASVSAGASGTRSFTDPVITNSVDFLLAIKPG